MFKTIIKKIANGLGALSQNTGGKIDANKCLAHDIAPLARQLSAEGIVLLKNDNNTLPLSLNNNLAVFGRVQYNYFYVGYGSGGDVKSPYYVNLLEGLKNNNNININNDLEQLYKNWCVNNVPDEGYWGHWPLHFPEMPLNDDIVKNSATQSDVALVVIGRAAGEDRDQSLIKGSYYITYEEDNMLSLVCNYYNKVIVLINSGNIMDLSFISKYGNKITSLIYAWQGGMESGNAIADILSGKTTPSGKLTDTIAINYTDYPSCDNFNNKLFNNYAEDIYVGYRYFNTFAQDKVMFPFGFGLSYTQFKLNSTFNYKADKIYIDVQVENTGDKYSGKEIVQVYFSAPQGKIGKAQLSLVAFKKSLELKIGERDKLTFEISLDELFSYDDKGYTGHPSSYVLEEGVYSFYVGNCIDSVDKVGEITISADIVVPSIKVCAVEPQHKFNILYPKMENGIIKKEYKSVATRTANLKERIIKNMPAAIPYTGDVGIKLVDVKNKKVKLDDFIAQLTPYELEILCRGDLKMNSRHGFIGNAGAFGGISKSLQNKGIPPVIVADGPSGIRLLAYASLLPCGTAISCSWNAQLVEKTYNELSKEMSAYGVDVLLGPGMNIHRDPLCGRNFEYFSEDPLLTGEISAAMVNGLQSGGVSACPKHFACNNQESYRSINDSRVSERALREIYLKAFEICVKKSSPHNIMTSYNKINGVFSYNNYDLCTTILRGEWGYKGNVMTDWWTKPSTDPDFKNVKNCAYRIRAQVDVLMPGGNKVTNRYDKSAYKSYKKKALTLGELQRSAKNVLSFILNCNSTSDKL